MLPERNEACLPSNPPRKYNATRITTRVSVVRLGLDFNSSLPDFI
jgi:hypothetical protein